MDDDLLREIHKTVIRTETKMDILIPKVEDHEGRIRNGEDALAQAKGAGRAFHLAAAGSGGLLGWLLSTLGGKHP